MLPDIRIGIEFALWGAAGSFAVDGFEITTDVKKLARWPWGAPGRPGVKASIGALVIRAAISGLVATASGMNHTVNGVFGAFAAGVAAPVIIEKLGKNATEFANAATSDGTKPSNDAAVLRTGTAGKEA